MTEPYRSDREHDIEDEVVLDAAGTREVARPTLPGIRLLVSESE